MLFVEDEFVVTENSLILLSSIYEIDRIMVFKTIIEDPSQLAKEQQK